MGRGARPRNGWARAQRAIRAPFRGRAPLLIRRACQTRDDRRDIPGFLAPIRTPIPFHRSTLCGDVRTATSGVSRSRGVSRTASAAWNWLSRTTREGYDDTNERWTDDGYEDDEAAAAPR